MMDLKVGGREAVSVVVGGVCFLCLAGVLFRTTKVKSNDTGNALTSINVPGLLMQVASKARGGSKGLHVGIEHKCLANCTER